jgi:hypothetical protein
VEGDGVLGCGAWRMETTKVVPVSLKLGWLDATTRTEGDCRVRWVAQDFGALSANSSN